MRLRHTDGSVIHLGYCTNVHAEEEPGAIARRVAAVGGRIRERLGSPLLGVGIWFPAAAARQLREDDRALLELRDALAAAGLEVVTLNGFPYGGFHAPVVKHAVYQPDWADHHRLQATIDLAHVLAVLLPDDAEQGSISTLPLGWRMWMDADARAAAGTALTQLGDELHRLRDRTGRRIRVGLEPEPGCVLDTAAAVTEWVAELGHPAIGVALDACHLAVEFEDPHAVAARLHDQGLDVVKLQVSSALRSPAAPLTVHRDRLGGYVEPRFLHQTRAHTPAGVIGTDDLDTALADGLGDAGEWRVHLHVPVHHAEGTTQDVLEQVLDTTVGGRAPLTRHLEVETYTWSVLPPALRPNSDEELAGALAAELAWTREQLVARGCTEFTS